MLHSFLWFQTIKKTHDLRIHRETSFPMRGKGLDQLTWAFILGCSMGHSFDTTAALCGLRFGCSCSVLSKKNMSDVEVTFLNREKGRFLDFWRIQIHQRSMKCVFKAWRFSLRSQLRIQKHRVGAVREKIAVSLNEAEAVLTKTMPRQVRLCWLNHVEKNWQTKVVDDIKGPCRDCTVCLNLIEFIYCIRDGYDWKLCFLLCI